MSLPLKVGLWIFELNDLACLFRNFVIDVELMVFGYIWNQMRCILEFVVVCFLDFATKDSCNRGLESYCLQ